MAKLDNNFFHIDNDIFVCVTYLPPDNSTYSNHRDINCMDLLEEQIQLHSRSGNICIIGDLNARTAENLDYVHNDSDKFIPESIPYEMDNTMPIRYSQYKICNGRGEFISDLCNGSEPRCAAKRTDLSNVGV